MPEEGGASGPMPGPDTELRWRVNSGLTTLKIGGAVVFLLAAVAFAADSIGVAFGAIAGAALGAFGLRDLLAPVRLAADPGGVTVVSGFAGRSHLAWEEIERIRVDERRRFGVRSQLLEIDTDTSLHLFSGYELSAPCADVAATLEKLRERATGQ